MVNFPNRFKIIAKFKKLPSGDMKCVYEKVQSLVHYSYELCKRKFMPLGTKGSMCNLHDLEIASSELFDGEGGIYFCLENLSQLAILTFVKEQVCSGHYRMLVLKTFCWCYCLQMIMECKIIWR